MMDFDARRSSPNHHSLYKEYRTQRFYWESIVMLRKLLCAAALVLLNNQALEAQLTVMAIVIVVALALHLVRWWGSLAGT